ncbi:MAG: hypothetical protein HN526_05175, partial [Gammaproteobacteria bacterium]|nr:hypothetical protein [Gammaproteobacteria bacterium]
MATDLLANRTGQVFIVGILAALLATIWITQVQYLALPDGRNSGKGMIAGGSLSALLGAVMLTSLDQVLAAEIRPGRILYIRYMGDFVVLAKTRDHFRRTMKQIHAVMR